jgi:DNA-binding GntR family transcriptional regulator
MSYSLSDSDRKRPGAGTVTSAVYDRLLDDILSGRLKPGSKLRFQALEKAYGVGNSPLREALNRLSSSGLVVREENKGFRVSSANRSEVVELIKVRCWVEELALRESIRCGDEHWEEQVILACHRLSRAPRFLGQSTRPCLEWETLHREFHRVLLSACGSKILLDFCNQLQARMSRYRNMAAKAASYRNRQERDEHGAIRDAVLDRNADRATELLRDHYRRTGQLVLANETWTEAGDLSCLNGETVDRLTPE